MKISSQLNSVENPCEIAHLDTIYIDGQILTENLFQQIKFISEHTDSDDVLDAITKGEGKILGYCLEPIYDSGNAIGQHKQYLVIVNKFLYRVCAETEIDEESKTSLIEETSDIKQLFYF